MNKKEAADYLGVSVRAVERHTARGHLSVRYQRGPRGDEAVYDDGEVRQLKAQMEKRTNTVRGAVTRETLDTPDTQSLALSGVTGLVSLADGAGGRLIAALEAIAARDHTPMLSLADKLTLSLSEASQLSGLSRGLLREAIKGGKLKAKIIGRGWRVKRGDLETYVQKL